MRHNTPAEGVGEAPKPSRLDSSPAPSAPSRKALLALLFVAGLAGSIFATWLQTKAFASRNNSGVYSLPNGNPVTTGTTITSTWANTTLSDLGTEITNSLDRNGRGAMNSPLPLSSGTAGAPGLTFSADTSSGLYRASSHVVNMSINGNAIQSWGANNSSIYGFGTNQTTLTLNPAGGNSTGLATTGAGTSPGLTSTGGATSGIGATFTGGAPNGVGVSVTGTGTGDGVSVTGSHGVNATGSNYEGVYATGAPGWAGGKFVAGTSATGSTRYDGLTVQGGDVTLDGVANPNSNVSIKNRVTPKNIVKAWVMLTSGSGGAVVDGFNISSVSSSTSAVIVSLAQAMASGNYAPVCIGSSTAYTLAAGSLSTGSFQITGYNAGTLNAWNPTINGQTVYCVVLGAQ